jgi:hypothetical protein
MVLPISDYFAIAGDSHAPQSPKPSLEQWDNYQIYSLLCIDRPYDLDGWQRRFYAAQNTYQTYASGNIARGFDRILSIPNLENSSGNGYLEDFVAIQTYSPYGIPFNFADICSTLTVQPRNYYNQIRITSLSSTGYDGYVSPIVFPSAATPNPFDAINIADTIIIDALNLSNPLQFSWLKTWEQQVGAVLPSGDVGQISVYGRSIEQAIYSDDSVYNPIPSYKSLIGGYLGDTRAVQPNNPLINIPISGKLKLAYYRPNTVESIPHLISLDWIFYEIDITKNNNIYLPLIDVVLGTLMIEGDTNLVNAVQASLALFNSPRSYQWSDYYGSPITIFNQWVSIYQSKAMPIQDLSVNLLLKSWIEYGVSKVRVLAANNNHWANTIFSPIDLNFDIDHPLFKIDNLRAYNWHVRPVVEGVGTLIMDSPRTIEIHAALEAGKYAINELDPTIPRVSTLGHHLERQSQLLGYRVDANGKLDVNNEKDNYIRQEKNKDVKEEDYGGNSFTSKGMLVRRLSNKFDKKGIVDGGVMGIHDIPQLILECLDQHNLAIGLQESSAIEIRNGDEVYRYPNQLALITDIFIHQLHQSKYAKSTFISSLVTQEQTKEIIGGMGLPTIQKTIPNMINGSLARIPFWGIAPQASLARKIDACTYNVGVVLGQLI